MPQITDVHQEIEDTFVANLKDAGVNGAAAEELLDLLSTDISPKPGNVIAFFKSQSDDEVKA